MNKSCTTNKNNNNKNNNNLKHNNIWIEKLLETKSYSLIISKFRTKNTNHFELSMYKLLQIIYRDVELFDFGIRYLVLGYDNLEQNQIDYLDSYIKSKSIIEYTFMHKYVLKTPNYVSHKILQIEKLNPENNYFRIRYEEKNYILRYELNNSINKYEHTNILWLCSIFIMDEVDEYECNISRIYRNKTNIFNAYEKVIFYENLDTMIFLSDYFIDLANKNIDSWHKFNPNDLITYKYTDWIDKYFGGNIDVYIKK